MSLIDAINAAYAADRSFQIALELAGFASRWHWHLDSATRDCVVSLAYRTKLAADIAMHEAFAASRNPHFIRT